MTLLELIVALTISGLALGAGYSVYGTLVDRRQIAVHRADETARAAALRETLISWLANSRLTVEQDDIVFASTRTISGKLNADPADSRLTFFTSARTPIGNAGTVVKLYVEKDSAREHGLVAEMSDREGRRHLRILLDSSVVGLDATVLADVFASKGWLSTWISSTVLPAAVRVVLSAATNDSLPPLLRLPITVSLENGR